MFAGITLGGLGTAYGALVGSFVVGLFVELSTLFIPTELKNVGALVVLIVVLLVRPAGHPRSSRADRLKEGGTVDWNLIFSVSLTTAFGSARPIVFALAAIGLNVHFGYTGLVNFGQVGFLAVGAYTVAMGVDTFGLSFWLCVFLVALHRRRPRPDPRRADPAAARRLPRHRHHRRRRDHPPRAPGGPLPGDHRRRGRHPELRRRLLRPQPVHRWATRPRHPRAPTSASTYSANQMWVLLVGWSTRGPRRASSCTCSSAARGAGCSRPSARTRTPCAASARTSTPTSCSPSSSAASSAPSAASSSPSPGSRWCPTASAPPLTFFAYLALVLGGAARVLGPVLGSIVFFFISAFVDVALRQAIEADYINFLVGQRGRHRAQHPRRPRPDGADDLPTAGHHRRQAGGGRQCPALSRHDRSPMAARSRASPRAGRGQARPDPRRRRRPPHASAASPPSTSTTSRCSGAPSPRSSARTAPARRRSSTCSPASTSPTAARGRFDGQDLAGVPAHKVARLGHGPHLPAHQVARPPLGAREREARRHRPARRGVLRQPRPAAVVGARRREVEARAEELLARFKLDHMRDEYAGSLSGGQRKLLEMARALMVRARPWSCSTSRWRA